jgi:hypothetical protein
LAEADGPIPPPALVWRLLEGRALAELAAFCWTYPLLTLAPRGDGHPVLVLPGFLASGSSTWPLRRFLKGLGYAAHRWKLGRNLGPVGGKEHEVAARLHELRKRYGCKVSLIGWSLGGLYARELAWMAPDDVRIVITLGSPLRHHSSTAVSRLYERITGQRAGRADAAVLARLSRPPPVPTTAIYSHTDGVVPWRCSREECTPTTENIRVRGSHCGLGHNPLVLWAIADRLALPDGGWHPFQVRPLGRSAYPAPETGA